MENVVENAKKAFLESMKDLKNSYADLSPEDRAKMQGFEKRIIECFKNNDIDSLKTLIKDANEYRA